MNGTYSTAAIRPTSGNHQQLLDDEPRTRWPSVERADAGTSDNVDRPDLRPQRWGSVYIEQLDLCDD
jgi:hypothetical protein